MHLISVPSSSPHTHQRPYVTINMGRTLFEVDARYVDLRPIGKGAYGLVVSAYDTLKGRYVAIKRIAKMFYDLIDAKRILREVMLLRYLGRHDNLVELLDVMTNPPHEDDFHTLYIVTTLFECDLERIVSSSQLVTDAHVQYFLYQILRGLSTLHSCGIIHRDLKPGNLLVRSNCDLSICDFGLGRSVGGTSQCETGAECVLMTEYVCTRWYRAPELLLDSPIYGRAVDLWSVGCVLGELLGRGPLFRGESTRNQLELILARAGWDEEAVLRNAHIHVPSFALPIIRRFKSPKAPQPWSQLFPHAPPQALDLLTGLLQFDPSKRLTVDQALAHPFFLSLARVAPPLPPTPAQGGRPPFSAPFESVYPDEAPVYVLQAMMRAEIEALHAGLTTPVQFAGPAPSMAAAAAPSGAAADAAPAGAAADAATAADDEGMA